MDKYSSVFDNLDKYKNDVIFHPESIIGYNLFVNNINVKTYQINFQFNYHFLHFIKLFLINLYNFNYLYKYLVIKNC
jgi:hypothetical protein